MRIQIFKDGQSEWIKQDRLERFLELGWQLAQPAPKKSSKPKAMPEVVVEANAEVITESPVETTEDKVDDDFNANH